MADEQVYITHPDVKAVGGPMPASSLPYWEAKGWKQTDVDFETVDATGETRAVPKRSAKSATTTGGK